MRRELSFQKKSALNATGCTKSSIHFIWLWEFSHVETPYLYVRSFVRSFARSFARPSVRSHGWMGGFLPYPVPRKLSGLSEFFIKFARVLARQPASQPAGRPRLWIASTRVQADTRSFRSPERFNKCDKDPSEKRIRPGSLTRVMRSPPCCTIVGKLS